MLPLDAATVQRLRYAYYAMLRAISRCVTPLLRLMPLHAAIFIRQRSVDATRYARRCRSPYALRAASAVDTKREVAIDDAADDASAIHLFRHAPLPFR